MAQIILSDGRTIPIVKPHIGDQMELERQMRAIRKGYGPKEFTADLKLASFNQAFSLFASFLRAGVDITIQEVLAIDMSELGGLLKFDAAEVASAEGDESEGEGEQTVDPTPAPTVVDDAPAHPTTGGLSAIG